MFARRSTSTYARARSSSPRSRSKKFPEIPASCDARLAQLELQFLPRVDDAPIVVLDHRVVVQEVLRDGIRERVALVSQPGLAKHLDVSLDWKIRYPKRIDGTPKPFENVLATTTFSYFLTRSAPDSLPKR